MKNFIRAVSGHGRFLKNNRKILGNNPIGFSRNFFTQHKDMVLSDVANNKRDLEQELKNSSVLELPILMKTLTSKDINDIFAKDHIKKYTGINFNGVFITSSAFKELFQNLKECKDIQILHLNKINVDRIDNMLNDPIDEIADIIANYTTNLKVVHISLDTIKDLKSRENEAKKLVIALEDNYKILEFNLSGLSELLDTNIQLKAYIEKITQRNYEFYKNAQKSQEIYTIKPKNNSMSVTSKDNFIYNSFGNNKNNNIWEKRFFSTSVIYKDQTNLEKLYQDKDLKIYNLSNQNITSFMVDNLCKYLSENENQLEELNLSENDIGVLGAKSLAEFLKHKNCKLKNLNISGNIEVLATGILPIIEALKVNDSLEHLSMQNIGVAGAHNEQNVTEALASSLSENHNIIGISTIGINITNNVKQKIISSLLRNRDEFQDLNKNSFVNKITKLEQSVELNR